MKKIALVGYSFRFPGTTRSRFLNDLLSGADLVSEVDAERWALETFRHPDRAHPGTSYTFAAGSLGDVSGFDAGFFGISPREAAQMDPQQRLLLELSWEAFEHAGIKPSSLKGSPCGVYIGIASADYSYRFADDLAAIDSSFATGNTASIAANRLSYFFDLRGPSMAIDTACSSSLVAFHQACCSIASGESTHALAGGVSLHLHPYGFITFSKASMLSRRGRCSVFDADGDGYVRSEGGGIFVLKDYETALSEGDRILAVIVHSTVNTDGRKSGLTVPSVDAQAMLLDRAYSQAGISPDEIDYIEAHGTGTAVGDPVETRALGEALGKRLPPGRTLRIGSVKSNIGHLEAASGVAGLVKALYCLEHRIVPATIGIEKLNPNIPLQDLNLEIVRENTPLKKNGRLVIGVNSFGFGGANAHVILETPTVPTNDRLSPKGDRRMPFVLSGRTDAALTAAAQEVAVLLGGESGQTLYDLSYHSVFRREWLDQRAVFFAVNRQELIGKLQSFASGDPLDTGVAVNTGLRTLRGPVFVYTGNGSQWEGMGRRLMQNDLFLKTIREIDSILAVHDRSSIEDELAGRNGEGRYDYTEIAQPALFAVQVGITQMLRAGGVHPIAVAGHSVGEVAAAWACGALSLEDAVAVIFHRSRLQGMTKGNGRMTAVGIGKEAAVALIREIGGEDALCLAGVNSARGVTVAGAPDALDRLEALLAGRNIFYKRLELDYAFHSPAMETLEPELIETLKSLRPRTALIPFFSAVTGKVIGGTELHAEYWWNNIRMPVLFHEAMQSAQTDGLNMFVEIGPHPVLRAYLQDALTDAGMEGRIVATGMRDDDAPNRIEGAIGQVIAAGAEISWESFFPVPGTFAELPDYPWQRERHWHDITPESLGQLYRTSDHPLLGCRLAQHELTWENGIDVLTHPVLADHVVGDGVIFPGTGFAELALAAARAWEQEELVEIEELEIRAPIVFGSEHAKILRVQIDSQDGSFTIKAREQMQADDWTVHAVGRILREPCSLLLDGETMQVPARPPDFDRARHEEMTKTVGLSYGPAFQAIDRGWIEPWGASALFDIPHEVAAELDQYHMHPALLDNAFQLIIQILRDHLYRYIDTAFVPVKLGRIVFRSGAKAPRHACAMLRRQSPHSLLADFTLFDAAGLPVASVKDVRFRSIRLHRTAVSRLSCIDYACVPVPHAAGTDPQPVISFEIVSQALREAVRRCVLKGSHRRYSEEIDPLLDELASRFAQEAFSLLEREGQGSLSESLQECRTAVPGISPFIDVLCAVLEDAGLLMQKQTGMRLCLSGGEQPTAQDIWNSMFSDYPDYFPIIQAVGRIGMHLRELIKGETAIASICPRDASFASLSRQVLGVQGKYQIDQAIAGLVKEAHRTLPEGRRFKVLELSGGNPLYAPAVISRLDADCGDYGFVTTSQDGYDEAQVLKSKYPAVTISLIDASSPVTAVGLCHLAIITLDAPSIRDAVAALRYAASSLVPGGSVIVVGQHPTFWMDFVFGAQQGWWQDSSSQFGTSHQKSVAFWQRELRQVGFEAPALVEFSPESASGPWLLLAAREAALRIPSLNERSAGRTWLLVAEEPMPLVRRLESMLRDQGDRAVSVFLKSSVQADSLVQTVQAEQEGMDGILFIALPSSDLEDPEKQYLHQVAQCTRLGRLVAACETFVPRIPFWLVTSGAIADQIPGRRASSPGSFGAAVLWGFARTLINETPDADMRLVDVEIATSADVAAALVRELVRPDSEREVILTAKGERFAPRLRLKQCPDRLVSSQPDSEQSTVHLGFDMPGQLRNLQWERSPWREPAEHELMIQVFATGLNFRDVMYTLGLLSDEAIEDGFAGPTLGLEFAGIVVSAGVKAGEGFALGDSVVGFGPASFGTTVVTTADAVAHIPPGMSFEAAATIPSAFFTAYYALHHLARLGEGERVLIHGAAGGVGIAAIQIAKWCGAEVFATAGSDEKRDFLRLLGVDRVFDSRSLAFADEILAATGNAGVDVVLNSLAGEVINRNFRVLRPFGRFLELGKRDFYENTKVGLRPFRNNISYFGIDADQLMQNRPELTRKLFHEVMDLFVQGVLHPLPYQIFEADEVIDAFRCMQQARHIGKIVVTYRNEITAVHAEKKLTDRRLDLAAGGSWLVTGGLSGFGLRTAQWLAERGVRHLILISRSGPVTDEARRAIEVMQGDGVRILATACDVTDRNALAGVLDAAADQFPPLRGIVHAAAVIDDGLIRTMDDGQISRVLAPKILGARHLHDLTCDQHLEFFILYSSATTLFGNPGQGNYVAANTWLESLARYRRACGLPATCLLWGAIDDVGFLARNEKIKDALNNRMGGNAINSSIALDVLEAMLLENRSGEGVLELDWRALGRFLSGSGAPKFGELSRHGLDQDVGEESGEDIRHLLTELPDEELVTLFAGMLQHELGEILRIPAERVDVNRSVYDMGLDSLMGVELVVALEARFGIRLPVLAINENPTILKLAHRILVQLRSADSASSATQENAIRSQIEQVAAQHAAEIPADVGSIDAEGASENTASRPRMIS